MGTSQKHLFVLGNHKSFFHSSIHSFNKHNFCPWGILFQKDMSYKKKNLWIMQWDNCEWGLHERLWRHGEPHTRLSSFSYLIMINVVCWPLNESSWSYRLKYLMVRQTQHSKFMCYMDQITKAYINMWKADLHCEFEVSIRRDTSEEPSELCLWFNRIMTLEQVESWF